MDHVFQNISLLDAQAMQMKRMSRCVFSSLTRPAHLATALAVVVASTLNYFMHSFRSWASQDFSGQLTSLQLNGWQAEILFFVSEIAFWRLSLYSPSKRIFCSWDHDWNDDWNDDWTGLAIFIALCFALSHAIDCLQLLEAKSLSFSETSMDGISLMTFVPRFHGTGYNSEYSHDLDLSSDLPHRLWFLYVSVCPRWKNFETISWTNTRIWRSCNASRVEMVWICLDEGRPKIH